MIVINRDDTRDEHSEGTYWVELVDTTPGHIKRLGYWCDAIHLGGMAEIMARALPRPAGRHWRAS